MPRAHRSVDEDLGSVGEGFKELASAIKESTEAAIAATKTDDQLETELKSLQNQVDTLNKSLAEYEERIKTSADVEAFEKLKKAASDASRDFEAFVKTVGLAMDSVADKGEGNIREIFNSVKDGSKTYMDAVRQVKAEYSGLLRENQAVGVDTSMIQGIISGFDGVIKSVEALSKRFDQLGADGEKGFAGVQKVADGNIAEGLDKVSAAVSKIGGGASEAYEPLTKLVDALKGLSGSSATSLANIAVAFRSLSEVGQGSFGEQKVTQVLHLITEIKKIANSGFDDVKINLSGLSDIKIDQRKVDKIRTVADSLKDLKEAFQAFSNSESLSNLTEFKALLETNPTNGLNNLKVSKASLNNLKTYLPDIEKVNMSKIQKLFGMDTSGINSLKVSKASIANVENLARAVEILKENNIDLSLKGDSTEELKKIMDNMQGVTQVTQTATSAVDEFETALFNVTNSAGLKGDVRTALSTGAVPTEDIDKIVNALDAVDGKVDKIKVNWKNYGDEGRHVTSVILSGVNETEGAFQRIVQFTREVNEETDKVTWTARLAQGSEQFKIAAEGAAEAETKLIEIDGRLADVILAKRKAQEAYDNAVRNGVASTELQSIKGLIGSYEMLEEAIKSGGVAQEDYSLFMGNASSKARLLISVLNDQSQAQKELKDNTLDTEAAIVELSTKQLDIQRVIDKAMNAGVSGDNDAIQALINLRDHYAMVESAVTSTGMSQQSYSETLDGVWQKVQLYSKQLGFAVEQVKAEAKVEAEAVNISKARIEVLKELQRVQDLLNKAYQSGISIDDPHVQALMKAGDELYDYESKIGQAGQTQKQFKDGLDAIKVSYAEEANSIQRSTKEHEVRNKRIAQATKIYDEVEKSLDKYKDAQNSSNDEARTAYATMNSLTSTLIEATAKYDAGAMTEEQYNAAVRNATDSLKEQSDVLDKAGYGVDKTSNKFDGLIQQLTRFLTPLYMARKAWQTLKEMANVVIELEDAFAQLEIVTGATESELEQFYQTSSKIASELGKSITDIAASIEVFSRLGYSLPDATVLAQYATVLSNVANVTTDEATTGLTSVIKGFGMHVDQAEHVSDVLVSIGQRYAVSAGELMEAFQRAGAALAATNTSFDKSAALIAAANAAIQNSSTVGRFMPMHTVMCA